MKREKWLATKAFSSGVMCLNALFCTEGDEVEITKDETQELVVELSKQISRFAVEDAIDILQQVHEVKKIK